MSIQDRINWIDLCSLLRWSTQFGYRPLRWTRTLVPQELLEILSRLKWRWSRGRETMKKLTGLRTSASDVTGLTARNDFESCNGASVSGKWNLIRYNELMAFKKLLTRSSGTYRSIVKVLNLRIWDTHWENYHRVENLTAKRQIPAKGNIHFSLNCS